MEYSEHVNVCLSKLPPTAKELLALAAAAVNAETLFVAKQTETERYTLVSWGEEREGIRSGRALRLPSESAESRLITVELPFTCGRQHGVLGALRAGKPFGEAERTALERAASLFASLVESEHRESIRKREEVLLQSRKNAQLAAQNTGELLAMMGHEIRTPMNGIVAMSQLLKETELNDEQRNYLQIIEDSQQSMLELVGSILDYGKLEARQVKLEPEPMDLIGALEDTAYQFAAKAAQRPELELTLNLDLDPELTLIGDVRKIRQVLGNLVSNAIKFTAAGEVRIAARRLEGDEPDRAWIEFRVSDTGIGLSEAGIKQLFRDYSQVHRPEEGDYGGTGLGLSISKKLVDLMGGRIWAEGRKGQGTRMTFVLPLKIGREAKTGGTSGTPETELRGKRLLIAAGGPGTRRALSLLTERWGLEVQAVSSGAEAIDAIVRRKPFDLVLSEWDIEEEASRLARTGEAGREPAPLLLLLPFTHTESTSRRGRSSALTLTKPVRQSSLLYALRTACNLPADQHAK
ncbi:ATP-binding protein [Saccharibacillus sp. CPCC 101409]|uniref:ATP-binding response regulator n=1 Tax=Saccharibacillus sp. CPCC 101409 TaxID=3058041 RepID=UPI002672FAF0|nr:ATP-binding protein [Saccharibacillus sp. CPCC 101409]MDO3410079.1 ATP-binding protein [Saccharibacillus sp. CPCC 101409]